MLDFVSVIIPCRNEELFIGKCLESVLQQTYPQQNMEILIADGMSTDATREILQDYAEKHQTIQWVDNPKKIVPAGLNILIKASKGQVIMRLDAHAEYPKDYIEKCVGSLEKYEADNVGGICVTRPQRDSSLGRAIVFILSHRFGVGNSLFRIGVTAPQEVDTVPFGCFRRSVFERTGFFNENLVRNQDIEFNLRLKKKGGKILLVPDITSCYYARSSLYALAVNNFLNGFWVLYSLKFAQVPFSVRHLVPFFLVLTLLVSLLLGFFLQFFSIVFSFVLVLYLMFSIVVSSAICYQRGRRYFFPLMASFWILHFSYGTGSVWGLIRLLTSNIGSKRLATFFADKNEG